LSQSLQLIAADLINPTEYETEHERDQDTSDMVPHIKRFA